jgi:hypothetical protein
VCLREELLPVAVRQIKSAVSTLGQRRERSALSSSVSSAFQLLHCSNIERLDVDEELRWDDQSRCVVLRNLATEKCRIRRISFSCYEVKE